ncbi:hypothetical protein [Pedobacter sp. UYP24]
MNILFRVIILLTSFIPLTNLYLKIALSSILMVGLGYALGSYTADNRKLIRCISSLAVFDGLIKLFQTFKFTFASLDITEGFVFAMLLVTTFSAVIFSFILYRLGAFIGFTVNKKRAKNLDVL